MVKGFESVAEVAALGDTFEPFAGQLPVHQADRLRRGKEGLGRLVRREVLGFAAPQGLADTATIVALKDAGYRYYLNDVDVSRAVPEIVEFMSSVFFPLQKMEVLKIFRTAADDFDVVANYRGPSPPRLDLAEGFLSDFHRILYLRGVYTLYFRNYLLEAREYSDILKAVLEGIKGQPVWITTGRDLARWWSGRAKVEAEARKISVHRIAVGIANRGESAVDNASICVYLPYRPKRISMSAVAFRLRPPHYQMLDQDNILRVDFPRLSAQTNYNYIVHLDE